MGGSAAAFPLSCAAKARSIDHIDRYVEIDRPRRLVFTWAVALDREDARRVTIEIVPAGAGCELTLVHEIAPGFELFKDRVTEGWTKMLGALGMSLD